MSAGPLGSSKGVEANVRSSRPCYRISTATREWGPLRPLSRVTVWLTGSGTPETTGRASVGIPPTCRTPSGRWSGHWLPVPGWLRGRGGQQEAYCHRAMLDVIRYLVDNGTKWRAMPADFPPWDRVYACRS